MMYLGKVMRSTAAILTSIIDGGIASMLYSKKDVFTYKNNTVLDGGNANNYNRTKIDGGTA